MKSLNLTFAQAYKFFRFLLDWVAGIVFAKINS